MSLQKLLEIRTKRKERIFAELQSASNTVVACQQKLEQASNDLQAYYIWKAEEQDSLFKELSKQKFTAKEYQRYLEKLAKIDVQERHYKEQIETGKTMLQTAKQDYEAIKVKSLAIAREMEKLTEILKGTDKIEKKKAIRKEEFEAEDFVPVRSAYR